MIAFRHQSEASPIERIDRPFSRSIYRKAGHNYGAIPASAKGAGTRVAVELALESARRLTDIPIRLALAALTDWYTG